MSWVRWPWPYTVQAQLIRRLTSYGAAAIGYDVVFSSSDTSAGLDNLQTIQASLAAVATIMMQSCKRSWSIPWPQQTTTSSSPPPCKNRVGRFWATFFTGNARTSPICLKANWSALFPQSDHLEKPQVCPQSGARGQPGSVALNPGLCG